MDIDKLIVPKYKKGIPTDSNVIIHQNDIET